jgi:hypothetical protein
MQQQLTRKVTNVLLYGGVRIRRLRLTCNVVTNMYLIHFVLRLLREVQELLNSPIFNIDFHLSIY